MLVSHKMSLFKRKVNNINVYQASFKKTTKAMYNFPQNCINKSKVITNINKHVTAPSCLPRFLLI